MVQSLRVGLLVLISLVPACAWAAGATLDRIGITAHDGVTQIAFHISSIPTFHYFALGSPARAVLDLDDTRAHGDLGHDSGGAVTGVRVGHHGSGKLRVVLDLAHGAQLQDVSAQGSHTLIMQVSDSGQRSSQSTSSAAAKRTVTATSEDTSSSHAVSARSGQPRTLYTAALENGPITVVIDPGHGGHDPGTRGSNGLREKTVTLAIARRVYSRLKGTAHIHPVLTRDDDSYVSLDRRVAIAQAHHADLFVSIHENAYPDSPSVHGGTCYVLSEHGASDAKAAQLAHFENNADPEVAGVHFSSTDHTLNAVLTDLYQNSSINDAEDLAKQIITGFAQVGPIYHRAPLRANFQVLRDPVIPSVLCETAFLSNPHQAAQLQSSSFRNQLADAIYEGIVSYFHSHPPMQLQANHGHYSPGTYVVQSGDTLSEIADAHNLSQQAIMAINHLHSASLHAGQRLQLPDVGG